ncbi:kielin/chordin-like protein [Biomphalaria glabrata]|uniref:Kielin/chordin-like protein n=1 Tax=Biomphalaria glabrata TaxID=6526 RepID=A0A9W3BHM9_BIOGL|nr:kielin/chordin-like protein [Biomphalaria glabrata]
MKTALILLVTLLCVATMMAQDDQSCAGNVLSTMFNAAPCVIEGVEYADGERTPDPCNRCWCGNGEVYCNRMGCPRADNDRPVLS